MRVLICGFDGVQGLLAVTNRAAENDEAIVDEAVHECRVPGPAVLVPDLTRGIPASAVDQPHRKIGHARSVRAIADIRGWPCAAGLPTISTTGHAADRAVSWQAILPTSVRRLGSLQFVSRYVILVANDPDLFDNVRGTLLLDGRFIDAGDMIHCDGSAAPLTNIYPIEMTAADWAGWNSGSNPGPDVRTASTLLFECRSASWVAEVSSLLAENLAVPIWLVDSVGNVWPAASVDPERIKLD